MRYIVIVGFLVVLTASVDYATGFGSAPVAKALGGGTANVEHCQVLDYYIASLDTISSINADVQCDTTGTYDVNATVNSPGASSGTGANTGVSFTANVSQLVTITISPSVAIGSLTYDADVYVSQ